MLKRLTQAFVLTAILLSAALGQAAENKILVYTRNYVSSGKGYVHDNIKTSVEAIKKLGRENGFAVDWSEDPAVFSNANLKQYKVIVFSNSNNEAFANEAQREAFQRFIRAGGGFVGIHSASGSERKWPYYWKLVGGKFLRHPKFQPFTVRVVDPKHPSAQGLPSEFKWTDECYYHTELAKDTHPVLVTDISKLDDPQKDPAYVKSFNGAMPLAWYHEFDGGRAFFTALGHAKSHYSDPILLKHILGGIRWAMREDGKVAGK